MKTIDLIISAITIVIITFLITEANVRTTCWQTVKNGLECVK
jgi:hypothetical protein